MTDSRMLLRAGVAATLTVVALGLGAPQAQAKDPAPAPPEAPSAATVTAAEEAAGEPETLDTLARFFAREGKGTKAGADPVVRGEPVPVYLLSADFVAGRSDAPIAELHYLASTAVAPDGRKASVWSAEHRGSWQVVNIATGDDETRYTAAGAKRAPGGTVFQEPQINAWYVQQDDRVLPLDEDARAAVGKDGTTVAAYQERVREAYGDKLPGSEYDQDGYAGGFGRPGTAPGAGVYAAPSTSWSSQADPRAVTEPAAAEPAAVNAAESGNQAFPSAALAGATGILGLVAAAAFGVRRLRRGGA